MLKGREQDEADLAAADFFAGADPGAADPSKRAALELREVQGLSFAEAAARLRTTPQAVKTRVCRTRALLKAKLG